MTKSTTNNDDVLRELDDVVKSAQEWPANLLIGLVVLVILGLGVLYYWLLTRPVAAPPPTGVSGTDDGAVAVIESIQLVFTAAAFVLALWSVRWAARQTKVNVIGAKAQREQADAARQANETSVEALANAKEQTRAAVDANRIAQAANQRVDETIDIAKVQALAAERANEISEQMLELTRRSALAMESRAAVKGSEDLGTETAAIVSQLANMQEEQRRARKWPPVGAQLKMVLTAGGGAPRLRVYLYNTSPDTTIDVNTLRLSVPVPRSGVDGAVAEQGPMVWELAGAFVPTRLSTTRGRDVEMDLVGRSTERPVDAALMTFSANARPGGSYQGEVDLTNFGLDRLPTELPM